MLRGDFERRQKNTKKDVQDACFLFVCLLMMMNDDLGIENDRLRHIRLHERINELPDPNYATLKYFLGHLDRFVFFFFFRYYFPPCLKANQGL